jgi:hypothetical protein
LLGDAVLSETFTDTTELLEREIRAAQAKVRRLQAKRDRNNKESADNKQEPVVPDLIIGGEAIAAELNKLMAAGDPWTAAKVGQDRRRRKFPPDIVFKYGPRTLAASRRGLHDLPARLRAWEAEKQAAAKEAAKIPNSST